MTVTELEAEVAAINQQLKDLSETALSIAAKLAVLSTTTITADNVVAAPVKPVLKSHIGQTSTTVVHILKQAGRPMSLEEVSAELVTYAKRGGRDPFSEASATTGLSQAIGMGHVRKTGDACYEALI